MSPQAVNSICFLIGLIFGLGILKYLEGSGGGLIAGICLYSEENQRIECTRCSNQALSNTKLGYVPMKNLSPAN